MRVSKAREPKGKVNREFLGFGKDSDLSTNVLLIQLH